MAHIIITWEKQEKTQTKPIYNTKHGRKHHLNTCVYILYFIYTITNNVSYRIVHSVFNTDLQTIVNVL